VYHSITFGDKNTWDDWRLIPTSRPVLPPPAVREKLIDIPGRNGLLDLSTLFTNEPTYTNRTGTFEFIIHPDYFTSIDVVYSNIKHHLHGQRMQMILEDDPEHYYEGLFFISNVAAGSKFNVITIGYDVSPYKSDVLTTGEEWLWDPFDFETGVINGVLVGLVVNGANSLTVNLVGSHKQMSLSFTTSADLTVTVSGATYDLPTGTTIIPGLAMVAGTNTLIFSGTGTVTITYRGGSL
jgi:phage-related protein